MTKIIDNKSYFFIGKFTDLIIQLSAIENKNMTLLEYLKCERSRLNKLLN